mmetsp:Transcript_31483/g.89359  ORF Transcript_31483/g.89359 Transcript_31483/m.89359 type:complete len:826 (+) Transcript_31483:407-2884(+)
MDEEETILFGGPLMTATAPPPPTTLKSALLGKPPAAEAKPTASPFLNLGAPVRVASSLPTPSKPRIKYTREELQVLRKNILMTDIPPGLDPGFIREQQEIAMGGVPFKNSPPRQGFFANSNWEQKPPSGGHNEEPQPSSMTTAGSGNPGSGWRTPPPPAAHHPDGGDPQPGMNRTNSWREPYKPPPGAGPVRSALVDGLQAEPPAGVNARGPRGADDRWGGGGGGRWGEGDAGRGRGRGRGDRQRTPVPPPDTGSPLQAQGAFGRGRSSSDGISRWGGSKSEDKWRSSQPGAAPTTRSGWKDRVPKDDRDGEGPRAWRQEGGAGAGGGAGGGGRMTAEEMEAERQRFHAAWQKQQAGGGGGGGSKPAMSVDDQEASWLQGDNTPVQQQQQQPEVTGQQQVQPAAKSAVEQMFGDAMSGVPSPTAPQDAAAETAQSSRFARWFAKGGLDESPKANAPSLLAAPAQSNGPQAAFSFQTLQKAVEEQGGGGALPLAPMPAAPQVGGPLPQMPSTFKTLADLEGEMLQPQKPAAAAAQEAASRGASGGAGADILRMLQGSGSAKPAATAPPDATPPLNDWADATSKLTSAAGAPQKAKDGPKEKDGPSQLSSLLEGLGIPVQPVAAGGAPKPAAAASAPTPSAPPAPEGMSLETAKPTEFPQQQQQQQHQGPSHSPPGRGPPPGFQPHMGMMPWPHMQPNMMPGQLPPGMPPPPGGWMPGMPPPQGMHGLPQGIPPPPGMPFGGPQPPPHMMHHHVMGQAHPGQFLPGAVPMPHSGGPLTSGADSSLGRFFNFNAMQHQGPMPGMQPPPMPEMPPKQTTLEELERQLQR